MCGEEINSYNWNIIRGAELLLFFLYYDTTDRGRYQLIKFFVYILKFTKNHELLAYWFACMAAHRTSLSRGASGSRLTGYFSDAPLYFLANPAENVEHQPIF